MNHVRASYGLEEMDLQDLMNKQKGLCAICGLDLGTLKYNYYIDHCHSTGKVRGLLCPYCNTGVGFYENSDIGQVRKYLNKG